MRSLNPLVDAECGRLEFSRSYEGCYFELWHRDAPDKRVLVTDEMIEDYGRDFARRWIGLEGEYLATRYLVLRAIRAMANGMRQQVADDLGIASYRMGVTPAIPERMIAELPHITAKPLRPSHDR